MSTQPTTPPVVTPADIQDKGNALAEAMAGEQAAKNVVVDLTKKLGDAQSALTAATTAKQKAQQDLINLLKG